MNDKQLELYLKQSLELRRAVAGTSKAMAPELARAMRDVRLLVETLPDASLIREKQWAQTLPIVRSALGPYSAKFERELLRRVDEMMPAARQHALEMLSAAGVDTVGATLTVSGVDSAGLAATSTSSIRTLFSVAPKERVSPWVKSLARMIDRIVRAGIAFGDATADLGKKIIKVFKRQGIEYTSLKGGTAASRAASWQETVIRNAVEDVANRTQDQAAKDLDLDIAHPEMGSEYVALLDSNTCVTCAWWDGEFEPERESLPSLPMHDNCQCSVVPVNRAEFDAARYGLILDPEGKGNREKPPELDPEDGPDTVKGDISRSELKPFTKRRSVIANRTGNRPNYADYLVQSNDYNRATFFGGGNAGKIRNQKFMAMVDKGMEPKRALKLMINGDATDKRFDRV